MHLVRHTANGGTGGLTYVVRDVNNYDWTAASFTKDDNYHDLDLSAIVPVGVKFVVIKVRLRHTLANQLVVICPVAYHTQVSSLTVRSQAANSYIEQTSPPIEMDATRKVTYYVKSGATYNNIDVAVIGWYL